MYIRGEVIDRIIKSLKNQSGMFIGADNEEDKPIKFKALLSVIVK